MSLEYKPESSQSLSNKRKDYKKSLKEQAKKHNTFLQNITGRGIKLKDIKEIDAEIEKGARSGEFNNEDYMNKLWRPLDNPNLTQEQNVERIANSNLLVLENPPYKEGKDNPTILKGKINGHDVNIKLLNRGEGNYSWQRFSGSIDNKEISQEEAGKIFRKYFPVLLEKEKRISDLKEEIEKKFKK